MKEIKAFMEHCRREEVLDFKLQQEDSSSAVYRSIFSPDGR